MLETPSAPETFGPYYAEVGKPFNYHLFVVVLPLPVIERLTMLARFHAAKVNPNPHDNRGDNMNYPVRDKEMVNMIRHCLINRTRVDATPRDYPWSYDNLLFRIQQTGIDVAARQLDLKLALLRLIAYHYPTLAGECDYQQWKLLNKSA